MGAQCSNDPAAQTPALQLLCAMAWIRAYGWAKAMRSNLLPSPDRPGLVLVVGGDASNGQALAGRLDGPPFSITLAHSAHEALALCETNLFEAILSDIQAR